MANSLELIEKVRPFTKSSPERLTSMLSALESVHTDKVQGDIVEIGVWRGGNIMLAMLMLPDRGFWLYDTFNGMTVPDPVLDIKRDGWRAIDRYNLKLAGGTKWDAVSLYECKAGFYLVGLNPDKAHWVVGPVEETAKQTVPEKIAILRLDVDWYLPTKIALETFYPKVSAGGVLIVDDYGHWLGCQKAVDEYFNFSFPKYVDVDYSCRVFFKC